MLAAKTWTSTGISQLPPTLLTRSFFNHPKQFRLQSESCGVDLVEKERSAVESLLKQALIVQRAHQPANVQLAVAPASIREGRSGQYTLKLQAGRPSAIVVYTLSRLSPCRCHHRPQIKIGESRLAGALCQRLRLGIRQPTFEMSSKCTKVSLDLAALAPSGRRASSVLRQEVLDLL